MGIAKLPEIRDYWKPKGSFHMSWFASIMTQDYFEEIYRYLHFAMMINKHLEIRLILINYTNWEYYHMNSV